MRILFSHLLSALLIAWVLLPTTAIADDGTGDSVLHPPAHMLLLHHADADQDGVVTADEWRAMTEAIGATFETLDEDADGAITVERGFGGHAARMPRMRHRFGRGSGDRWHPGDRAAGRGGWGLHRAADAAGDGDGTLSRTEWIDFLGNTDADSSGALSPEELHDAMRAFRAELPEPTGPSVDDLIARFDAADADGNGLLTDDERPRGHHRRHHPPRD